MYEYTILEVKTSFSETNLVLADEINDQNWKQLIQFLCANGEGKVILVSVSMTAEGSFVGIIKYYPFSFNKIRFVKRK